MKDSKESWSSRHFPDQEAVSDCEEKVHVVAVQILNAFQ